MSGLWDSAGSQDSFGQPHRPGSRWRQVWSYLEALGWIHFQSHSNCWQNSVLGSYRTETQFPCRLSARSHQLLGSTCIPWGMVLFLHLQRQSQQWQTESFSLFGSLWPLFHHVHLLVSSFLYFHLFFLLYRTDYIGPNWKIQDHLPNFMSTNLNSSSKLPSAQYPKWCLIQ